MLNSIAEDVSTKCTRTALRREDCLHIGKKKRAELLRAGRAPNYDFVTGLVMSVSASCSVVVVRQDNRFVWPFIYARICVFKSYFYFILEMYFMFRV